MIRPEEWCGFLKGWCVLCCEEKIVAKFDNQINFEYDLSICEDCAEDLCNFFKRFREDRSNTLQKQIDSQKSKKVEFI